MSDIDRAAPARRPHGRAVSLQSWREILFLHWPFPPEAVRPLVPGRLALDLEDGHAWVGLVPFEMRAIRPAPVPAWAGLDFLETNLRTYVHLDGKEPGVWFFSLDASSRLAVHLARALWKLPYHLAHMHAERSSDAVAYESARGSARGPLGPSARRPGLSVRAEIGSHLVDRARPSVPGTLDHFLLERYVLYAERRGRLYRGRVHHPPYAAASARVVTLSESLVAAAGLPPPRTGPAHARFAAGVDVEVFALSRV